MIRIFFIISTILFSTLFSFSQESWNKLEINEIKPGYFTFVTYSLVDNEPFPANGLYVVGDSAVIMIDTPWNEKQFQPVLDSIEKRHHKPVVFCLATHFHADRTAGLEYFTSKKIKTWSSRKTYELCHANKEKKAAFTFEKDTVFNIAGVKFEVFYPGPGHAPDNIVVYFPEARILHGGCFLKNYGSKSLGYTGDANIKSWKKGVKKVIKRYPDAELLIPGHFSCSGPEALIHTLNLLKKN